MEKYISSDIMVGPQISMGNPDMSIILFNGMVERLFYDFSLPSSVVYIA